MGDPARPDHGASALRRGAVDLFARCRRRRIPLGGAMRSLRAGCLLGLRRRPRARGDPARRLSRRRAGPLPPDAPQSGSPRARRSPSSARCCSQAGSSAASGSFPGDRRRRRRSSPGYTVALLALGLIALLVVATNPFALIFLLPSLHAWLWLPQAQRPGRGAPRSPRSVRAGRCSSSSRSRRGTSSASTRRGTSLVARRRSATCRGSQRARLAWLATAAQLAALAVGRYAPYPETDPRPRRRALRAAVAADVLGEDADRGTWTTTRRWRLMRRARCGSRHAPDRRRPGQARLGGHGLALAGPVHRERARSSSSASSRRTYERRSTLDRRASPRDRPPPSDAPRLAACVDDRPDARPGGRRSTRGRRGRPPADPAARAQR